MSNGLSSVIFMARNVDKVKHGDIGRAPVVAAQSVAMCGKSTAGLNALNSVTSKAGLKALDVCNFASKAVNPLLAVAGGVRVLASEDKEKSFFKEALGIGTMFAAEKGMKALIAKIGTKLAGTALAALIPGGPVVAAVVKALALVGTSILAYDAGAKIGENLVDTKREKASSKDNDSNANIMEHPFITYDGSTIA